MIHDIELRRACRIAAALGLIASCLLGGAAPAQDAPVANGAAPAAAPPTPAPPEPAVEPIPVTRIGVESETTKSRVADIREELKREELTATLADQIPARAEEVDALRARSKALRDRDPNLVEVDQLREEWRAVNEQLDRMQLQLGARSNEISRMREDLSADRKVWVATDEVAKEAGEEESVQAQIDEVLADLSRAIDVAKARQGEIASLQGRVAGLSESVREDLQKLVEIRRSLVGRVFERDRPPMTSPEFYQLLSRDEMRQRLIEHRDREIAAVRRFGARERDRLIIHTLATLVLIAGMFTARQRIRRLQEEESAEDPGLERMQTVFDRPIALALLLSLFVGLWGYAEIPPLAAPVVGITALVPAVLILRDLVARPVRPILYVLLGLYFVDRLNTTIAPLPGIPRVVFVAEMLVIFGIALWWRRPYRLEDVPRARLEAPAFRWVATGLRVAFVAAPVTIVAEAAGYTALSRILGGTVLTAGYAGTMLYGSAIAIDGLVAFLLRVRPLRLAGMVQRHRQLIQQHVQRVVHWITGLLFVWTLLRRLEMVDAVWRGLATLWAFSIPFISVGITLGSIIEFLIVVRLTFLLARFIEFVLEEEVYTRVRMRKGQPYAVSTLTRYLVLLSGFLLAVLALGLDVNRFTILAGAFGVGIGFGLQTIVNNFVSGIILLTEQPVQVGDTVELEGVWGEVQRIGIRSSTVRTWQGAEVIVPNAHLVSEQVTNWTLSDQRRRLEMPVGVAYGTDPARAIEVLTEAARRNPHVLEEPAPVTLFMGFGDSALDFEVRCWTDLPDMYLSIKSAIMVEMEAALTAAGITIPFPQRDLHLKTVDASAAEGLASRAGRGGPAAGSASEARDDSAASDVPDAPQSRSSRAGPAPDPRGASVGYEGDSD